MNERIKELLGRALDSAVPETWATLTPGQLAKVSEKFAELIVGECCDVLQNEDIRHGVYGYNQGFLRKKIKQHFGVKE